MLDPKDFCFQDLGELHFNEPLSNHSTWKIGGPADLLIEPTTIDQIVTAIHMVRSKKIPLVVIGNGSNILFSDEGIRGIVLKLGKKFSDFEIHDNRIIAESGAYVPSISRAAAKAGLSGLEHTIGIPGSIGGLVCMNGGSQKKSIGDILERVWVIDRTGIKYQVSRDDCHFSYRHSTLQECGRIVVKVELVCKKGIVSLIEKEMDKILAIRDQKFPMNLPSCGSVFLSDPEINLNLGEPGKLIEDAGLKGCNIGKAQVSLNHANFIVNTGGAKAIDIISLIHLIRNKIYEIHHIWLDCEIKYIDEHGAVRKLHEVKNNG